MSEIESVAFLLIFLDKRKVLHAGQVKDESNASPVIYAWKSGGYCFNQGCGMRSRLPFGGSGYRSSQFGGSSSCFKF